MIQNKKSIVILIDDDEDDRYLIRSAICQCDKSITMIEFSNGENAWGYLSKEETVLPSLIILDLNMPEIDGFEFLQRLRSSRKTKLTPCVVYTTSSDASDLNQSYELGANSYVVKPLSYDEIENVFKSMSDFWLNTALSPV